VVKAQRTDAGDSLVDPGSSDWGGISASVFTLQPTPITAQPSQYVQKKWKDTPYGLVQQLEVRAAHDGDVVYFRLSWSDESQNDGIRDTDQFPDASAVLFPVNDDAPLLGMGSPQDPVNGWYWRPDMEEPLSITAEGVGTTRRTTDAGLHAQGSYGDGGWQVVIRRNLASETAGNVNLAPGSERKVAFAVWQGGNQERGGLKSVTLDWEPLTLEA
jgi:DMSO reductase family type II enzyme heme b subunit